MPQYVEKLFIDQGIIVFLLNLVFDQTNQVNPDDKGKGDSYDQGDKSSLQASQILQTMQTNRLIKDNTSQKFHRQSLIDIAFRVEIMVTQHEGDILPGTSPRQAGGVLKAFIPDNFIIEIIDQMKRENTTETEETQREIVDK